MCYPPTPPLLDFYKNKKECYLDLRFYNKCWGS